MIYAQLHLTLPAWVHEEVDAQRSYPSAQDKVALAIRLSRLNVDHRSGGSEVNAARTSDGMFFERGEAPLLSCTLVTTAAAPAFQPWHARMPVLLRRDEQWCVSVGVG